MADPVLLVAVTPSGVVPVCQGSGWIFICRLIVAEVSVTVLCPDRERRWLKRLVSPDAEYLRFHIDRGPSSSVCPSDVESFKSEDRIRDRPREIRGKSVETSPKLRPSSMPVSLGFVVKAKDILCDKASYHTFQRRNTPWNIFQHML